MAACLDHPEVVKILLDTGMSHPEYQTIRKTTALLFACWHQPDAVQILLDTGMSHPEYRDCHDRTAQRVLSTSYPPYFLEYFVRESQLRVDNQITKVTNLLTHMILMEELRCTPPHELISTYVGGTTYHEYGRRYYGLVLG